MIWQTDYEDLGEYNLLVTDKLDGDLADSKARKIKVSNVNRAPVLEAIADLNIGETKSAVIRAVASGP